MDQVQGTITVTVFAGARAGLVKVYSYDKRKVARRFADKLDLEYGAICCRVSVQAAPVNVGCSALLGGVSWASARVGGGK